MALPMLNVLVSTFPGLDLPSVLCLPVTPATSISSVVTRLCARLPTFADGVFSLTTASGRRVNPDSPARISTLLSAALDNNASILSLRLGVPLKGGKGGFGSQLRAAGGRMSSRKKRAQGEQQSSNRNLDGRRLRTVNEAKALAEYLTVKPEMDKKEKEERRKRWEQVVEAAERREEEIKNGNGKARIDGKWLEEKEEAESKTREAIAAAMQAGLLRDDVKKTQDAEQSTSEEDDSMSEDRDGAQGTSSKDTTPPSNAADEKGAARKIYGWDEDEDERSDSEPEAEDRKLHK